jgi:hypothetical protein
MRARRRTTSRRSVPARASSTSSPTSPGQILDVGAACRLGGVTLYRQLCRSGLDAELTLVAEPDVTRSGENSDLPVPPTARTVIEVNLRLGGVPTSRYRLLDHSAQSALVGERVYGLIEIDGAQTGERVAELLDRVAPCAADSGLVVLDRVDDPAWPGTREALDRALASTTQPLVLVGVAAGTAFLRARSGDSGPHVRGRD